MISKSNKILLIASFTFVIIIVVFLFYVMNKDSNYLESKSGKYYFKMYILNKDNNKFFKWDVGISNNDIKRGIIQNEYNKEAIDKFTKVIDNMKSNRVSLFILVTYFIYILIIFSTANRDAHIRESDNKSFQLFFTLLIIFLIYKAVNYFMEYNNLCRDAVYYFNVIK